MQFIVIGDLRFYILHCPMDNLNSLTNQLFDRREAMRPTAKTWLKHIGLLLITLSAP